MSDDNLFPIVEGFSLFGNPLIRIPLRPEFSKEQEKLLKVALQDYQADSSNPENLIWLGRRKAYLGHIRDAIAIFTKGIEQFPNDARMYRHRGHRFISLRQFRLAIDDFEKAASLIKNKSDEVEPDGMPNARGIPTSTLHFNIWYHLGLAYYCEGYHKKALDVYRKCMATSDMDDKYVATGHWLYMTLRILGETKEAENVLTKVNAEMDIIENQQYHECLLMYKEEQTPVKLLAKAREQGAYGLTTIGYGIANWYNYNGKIQKAKNIYDEILSTTSWGSFGFIAAEADLKRLLEE